MILAIEFLQLHTGQQMRGGMQVEGWGFSGRGGGRRAYWRWRSRGTSGSPTGLGSIRGYPRVVQNSHCFAVFHPQVRVGQRAHLLVGILEDKERHSMVALLMVQMASFIRLREPLHILPLGLVVGRNGGPLEV